MKQVRKANAGVFCLAGAAVVWGLFAASRFMVAIPAAGGAVWAFPAWQWPAAAFLSAGVLILGLYAGQRRFLAGRGLTPAESARLAALAWLPSFALLVPLAMEAMGGPPGALGLCQEAWPLFALAALGLTAGLTLSHAPAASSGNRPGRWAGPIALFLALAAFLFCAHQVFRATQAGPLWGGDEPQYLYIAHSLAVDRDLDLYDQIMLRENIYFQTPEDMIGGHGRKSAGGVWLSKHMPGLPILLSPFYAWALRLGLNPRWPCSLFMMLCSAWLVWGDVCPGQKPDRPGWGLLWGRGAFGALHAAFGLCALCVSRRGGRGPWPGLFQAHMSSRGRGGAACRRFVRGVFALAQ